LAGFMRNKFFYFLFPFLIFNFSVHGISIKEDGIYAVIKTSMGEMICKLFFEQVPVTVANFVGLSEGTIEFTDPKTKSPVKRPFYNGVIFHRIIKDFMIQAGDPLGTGYGGPGYQFPNEIVKELKHDSAGILSMANAGPDTNGSQFFITLKPQPALDGSYSVFGKVIEGLDVLNSIGGVKTGQNDKPVVDVVIKEITIERIGENAKEFDAAKIFREKDELKKRNEELKKEAAKDFLKTLGVDESKLITTPSGLKYYVLKAGNKKKPNSGDTVSCNYTLYLPEGKKIDSSYDRNVPFDVQIGVGKVIKGWDEALLSMSEGEKRVLVVPSDLAYGDRGYPPIIPSKSILIFVVELLGVKK
jgi:peptidyl-prolyl cis-trans isomerase A (cyclophilin A)